MGWADEPHGDPATEQDPTRPPRTAAVDGGSRRAPARQGRALLGGRARGARQGGAGGGRRARRTREWEPAADRRRSGRAARGAGRDRACRSWCRSATGGCWCRRSRSTAAPRYLMAADLAGDAADRAATCSSAATRTCRTSACSRAPDRRLVFSINDFDETLPGPVRVGRQAARRELRRRRPRPRLRRRSSARSINRPWRAPTARRCATSPAMRNLDLWYARIDVDDDRSAGRRAGHARSSASGSSSNVAKARTKDSLRAFAKLTEIVDGEPRIVSDPPLIVPIEELRPAPTRPRSSTSSCAASSAPTGGP